MEKFFLLFITLSSQASASSSENFENIAFRRWIKVTPKVIICDKSVDFETVASAVVFWRSHGFKLSNPEIKSNCNSDILKNHIKFIKNSQPSTLKDNENGTTDRLFTNTKMYGANITIKENLSDQKLLIKHELGHALGLNHSDYSKSVMYYKRKYYASNK